MRNKIPMILVIYVISVLIAFWAGEDYGRRDAFQSLVDEECTLNEQSMDIECITYIAK